MHGLYSVGGEREEELITASKDLYELMQIAEEKTKVQFFIIKKIAEKEEDNQILGARIGWAGDVMWRLRHQKRKKSRDWHVLDRFKNLITKRKGD